MGYWALIIESTGGHTIRIESLRKDVAEEARAAIEERMNQTRTTAAAPGSASTSSIATQIRDLSQLRDDGLITEAEFDAKKRDLLDRM